MMVTTSPASAEVRQRIELRGGNWALWNARDIEILAEGPAGTGKTYTILNLLDALCREYDGLRALIVRKRAVTLTTTCLATFNEKVLKGRGGVAFVGHSESAPASYRYSNGSQVNVGGMSGQDEASKILSSEYDFIFANEAAELSLEDWETLLTRLRHGVLQYQRIIADTNPTYSAHWLMERSESGKTRLIRSKLEDNPAYFDAEGNATPEGAAYIARLERLTGTRYQRFRLGLRVGLENAIYPHFDRDLHVRPLTPDLNLRFVGAVSGGDYGRIHKSACVTLSADQYNRLWVRAVWGRPSDDHGAQLRRVVADHRARYGVTRGRVDPLQDVLAGQLGFNLAKSGEGSRQHRVDLVSRRLALFPGGRVPRLEEETFSGPRQLVQYGPWPEPDSPGLLIDANAEGADELAGQMEAYHYEHIQTERRDEQVVARVDEDLVAALEYAVEEWDEGQHIDLAALGKVAFRWG